MPRSWSNAAPATSQTAPSPTPIDASDVAMGSSSRARCTRPVALSTLAIPAGSHIAVQIEPKPVSMPPHAAWTVTERASRPALLRTPIPSPTPATHAFPPDTTIDAIAKVPSNAVPPAAEMSIGSGRTATELAGIGFAGIGLAGTTAFELAAIGVAGVALARPVAPAGGSPPAAAVSGDGCGAGAQPRTRATASESSAAREMDAIEVPPSGIGD